MTIVHISDTHGHHEKLVIPECDALLHSGDLGGRTTPAELMLFLSWFEKQPAKKKIFIAGNHDLCLDKNWVFKQNQQDPIYGLLAKQQHSDAISLIENYNVVYLNNTSYIYEGIKFYGNPYSPSFHRDHWVFNADRGEEILKQWNKIPSNTNVLLTHTPVYNFLDVATQTDIGENPHRGCEDLFNVIKKRLLKLQLHCCGHIHNQYGVVLRNVSNTRRILFSNGAMLDDRHKQLITQPIIITI